MDEDRTISTLRSRVSALVLREGTVVAQAFDVSREGGDRRGVDALFARVQALQVERTRLQKEIGSLLGHQRMHVAAEVWRPGVYQYREQGAADTVRVHVLTGPLGLLVRLPGQSAPVRIETLEGAFDGPLAVDDAAPCPAAMEPAGQPRALARPARKRPD
jgi:hypothetical protein